jgi:Tetracyclin repressor-like, C-terminal domain
VAAGLPPGSTSYYLCTRKALLTACVCTACWRDAATVVPSDHRAAPLDLLVETVLHLSREQPERQVARYELALEATRQPEIRAVMDHHARQLRLILARMLTQGGIRDADEASWPVAAMVDGHLRDRVAGLGATLTDAAFEASARHTISALFRGLCLPED